MRVRIIEPISVIAQKVSQYAPTRGFLLAVNHKVNHLRIKPYTIRI